MGESFTEIVGLFHVVADKDARMPKSWPKAFSQTIANPHVMRFKQLLEPPVLPRHDTECASAKH